MDDLDLYELMAGIDILEQVDDTPTDRRRVHKAVNPFTGKLHYSFDISLNIML